MQGYQDQGLQGLPWLGIAGGNMRSDAGALQERIAAVTVSPSNTRAKEQRLRLRLIGRHSAVHCHDKMR